MLIKLTLNKLFNYKINLLNKPSSYIRRKFSNSLNIIR